MSLTDLFLPAFTWPDPTSDRALSSGVALARRLGGQLTLLTVQLDLPDLNNPLANAILKLDRMAEMERGQSRAAAQLESMCARIAAEEAGVEIAVLTIPLRLYEEPDHIARLARTRNACLVAIGAGAPAGRAVAEAALFGSGRPVVIYPEAVQIDARPDLGTVAVAWDGGGRAARAVADALPLLSRARQVRIFVALGDKDATTHGAAAELLRHLQTHGVQAQVDERLAHDRAIGCRLRDYVAETNPDLLVMGGFGHARAREFILGGATDAMLSDPPCPVLLSH